MAKKKQSTTRRILKWTLGILAVLVLLGIVGFSTGLLGAGDDALAVDAEESSLRTLTQVVTASGSMQPEVQVKISPDVSGEIIELRVREGDTVEQGDLLARLRPDTYVAQVERARANVAQNRATLSERRADVLRAENRLNRQQQLYEREVISESDLEDAQTTFRVAESRLEAAQFAVESAEASLSEAEEDLQKTRIFAPMTGTVSKLDVELGERVVGTGMQAGTEMMRISRLNQMELEIDVNENDVINVSLGDTAAIEVDAYPEQSFRGMVTEIANTARVTGQGTQDQVTNFPVKIRVLDPHNQDSSSNAGPDVDLESREGTLAAPSASTNFRPGMTGTVDIFTQTVAEVVSVPIQAVTVRDFNQIDYDAADTTEQATGTGRGSAEDLRRVVFIVEDGIAQVREVETGIADDTHIHIREGLTEGLQVITGPYSAVSRELAPEREVRVREDRRTFAESN